MDHRISKDMISNGMTPSGQKSQQDLSRSQYGSAATPASLAEAYRKIHEMDERSPEANAAKQEAAKLAAQKALPAIKTPNTPTDSSKRPWILLLQPQSPLVVVFLLSLVKLTDIDKLLKKERHRKSGGMGMGESADLFDIVKGHLMSEGLSEEDALKKMLDMTEEEKTEILEMNAGPYVVTKMI